MKKKVIISILTAATIFATACGGQAVPEAAVQKPSEPAAVAETGSAESAPSQEVPESKPVESGKSADTSLRPALISHQDIFSGDPVFTPKVPGYSIEKDLSNVINAEEFSSISPAAKEAFVQYGFAVDTSYGEGDEFYEVYEFNRYSQTPNFVTTDSMFHTYHLFFYNLMKKTEKEKLIKAVTDLSKRMTDKCDAMYNELKGTEWESAAKRNTAFFATALKLLDPASTVPAYAEDTVKAEISKINDAKGIEDSLITGTYEDYSQYKPRGYYDTDEDLKKYFKAMMWYGRTAFMQDDEDLNRSALLISLGLNQEQEAMTEWRAVYAVTSFFAGESDDPGCAEYLSLIEEAYGKVPEISGLPGNKDGFDKFGSLTKAMAPPAINSVVFDDDEGETDKNERSKGFRLMGQRFTLDSAVFQQLIYSKTKENSKGDKRKLPDVLDIPAALGSGDALDILDKQGDTDYKNYPENMNEMQKTIAGLPESFWTKSLYNGWLNMLRPILEVKGEGYPLFMQNYAWTVKSIETFCGSFTELKHDTILYSKQVMAEMGGGPEDPVDDRGYVEPEPVVYSRLEALVKATSEGLDSFGLLSPEDKENLKNLEELSATLKTISLKELDNETLTDDECEFIRSYGGSLEHLWQEAMKGSPTDHEGDYIYPEEYPAALVADIATDPDGTVLEVGTGDPLGICVIVPVEGKLRIARGSVFDFYEFHQPLSERLTDDEWRYSMHFSYDPEKEYEKADVERPAWGSSAKVRFYEY